MIYLPRSRVVLGDNNCASSTPSFGTAQFRASEANTTKVFEQGDLWINVVQYDACAIEVEAKSIIVIGRNRGKRVGSRR
jgi:hypothetical protein